MAALPWISPADADDTLFDDPMGSTPDFGFALLRPNAKGKRNTTADLARAKLQPSKPDDAAWGPDGLWPITCTTSRLVPAASVAIEPDALESVFEGYDARVKPHQKLLATVLTMRFDHGWQAADILSLVGMYALQHLALDRRLTSLTVEERAGDTVKTDISIFVPRDRICFSHPGCRLWLSKTGSRALLLPQPHVRGSFRLAPGEIIHLPFKPTDAEQGIARADARLRRLVERGVDVTGRVVNNDWPIYE